MKSIPFAGILHIWHCILLKYDLYFCKTIAEKVEIVLRRFAVFESSILTLKSRLEMYRLSF
jgi:hypothetical protein